MLAIKPCYCIVLLLCLFVGCGYRGELCHPEDACTALPKNLNDSTSTDSISHAITLPEDLLALSYIGLIPATDGYDNN